MGENNISYESGTFSSEKLEKLLELLNSTKYGSITLIVQDGIVVQIEKNEKIRFK